MMALIKNEIFYDENGQAVQILLKAKNARNGQDVIVYQALYDSLQVLVMEENEFGKRFLMTQKVSIEEKEVQRIPIKDVETAKSETVESRNSEIGNKPGTTVVENEVLLENANESLLRFLDAENYSEKVKIFIDIKDEIDEKLLNNIAVSMDLVLDDGTQEEKYESLLQIMRTRGKFESPRLR